METRISMVHGMMVMVLVPDARPLGTAGDILDLMGSAIHQGANALIIHQQDLPSGFFELRTGIAGEILQKFSNYQMKLAIIGDFGQYNSHALNAFIIECNRGRHIFFVGTHEQALERLTMR